MAKKLFWIDLEMTGLDEMKDHILEVAVVVTDLELKTLEEYHSVVFQSPEIVAGMNDWCKEHHGKSGLTAEIPSGKPLAEVEQELIALARRHFNGKERIVLCGNSVGNDRRFVDRYWPEFAKLLHYRLIDVSSYKEIFRERFGVSFAKGNAHRATQDIHESIRELSHYLSFVVIPSKTTPASVVGSPSA
jgi:oligoribonuclease